MVSQVNGVLLTFFRTSSRSALSDRTHWKGPKVLQNSKESEFSTVTGKYMQLEGWDVAYVRVLAGNSHVIVLKTTLVLEKHTVSL